MSEPPESVVYAPGFVSPQPPRQPAVRWRLMLVIAFSLCALVAVVLGPNLRGPHRGNNLMACKSNCKNIGTALEMYAVDNAGQYPLNLAKLTARMYLKSIPTCPAASSDTYSRSYGCSQTPDAFSFSCSGNNHGKSYSGFSQDCSNFPQYTAEQGLIDHPEK
ncbi:hypothetical protein IV102_33440 [bacterium]|nr:hypothetical protein [bacterium]